MEQNKTYLNEIEKYFIKKRKKSLIMVPRDWTLIEKWYNMGIPVKVVKKGIDRGFENFYSIEENKDRGLNTIRYCESVIMEIWHEYKENMIGKSIITDESLNIEKEFDCKGLNKKKTILQKIEEIKHELKYCGEHLKNIKEDSLLKLIRDLYKQIILFEIDFKQGKITEIIIKEKLFYLQESIIKEFLNYIPPAVLNSIKDGAYSKLYKYKTKMSKDAYEKTLNSAILKNIKKYYRLPEITI